MNIVISILVTLLVFTLIIVIHEYGHYRMARRFGIFVEEFSIGMGPALIHKKTKSDMYFSVRALPIGGFCQMKGEEPDSSEKAPDADAFNAKPVGQRALVVAAGPFMNFVLALVLVLIVDFAAGYTTRQIASVDEGYPAAQAGVEAGDTIIGMNGEAVHVYSKTSFLLMNYQEGDTVELKVRKTDGQIKTYSLVLKYDENLERYRMGFTVKGLGNISEQVKELGFFPAIGGVLADSFWYVCYIVEITFRSLGMLLSGQVGLDAMTGPIGIVSVVNDTYTQTAQYGFSVFLYSIASLMVLLSANIGVLNLFPIPGLDGSRLVAFLIEKLRGKPINPKVESIIYLIGFILLIGLMVVVAANDIARLT